MQLKCLKKMWLWGWWSHNSINSNKVGLEFCKQLISGVCFKSHQMQNLKKKNHILFKAELYKTKTMPEFLKRV